MKSKHRFLDATIAGLFGVAVGLTVSLFMNAKGSGCNNQNHNEEYIDRILKDNITLDRMNQDLLHELRQNEEEKHNEYNIIK